jgi:hypothetical protein
VAVGEAFLTIARDAARGAINSSTANDACRRMNDYLKRGRIRLCGIGSHTGGDALLIGTQLRAEDGRLSATDALIAATALASEDCLTFYTNDAFLLSCSPLLSRARDKPMVVTEAPS